MPWPSSDLQILWASQYIDSSYNAPGVQSPVIDKLIGQIIAAQGDKAKLIPLGRALDRVLTELLHVADVVYGRGSYRPVGQIFASGYSPNLYHWPRQLVV